jgi:hypothetical protein
MLPGWLVYISKFRVFPTYIPRWAKTLSRMLAAQIVRGFLCMVVLAAVAAAAVWVIAAAVAGTIAVVAVTTAVEDITAGN